MITRPLLGLLAAAAFALAAPNTVQAAEGTTTMTTQQPQAAKKTGHVDVNGVNYYYEIHGEGEPLLLLHGGLGSIDMFGPVLPILAENRQVIGVDLHGHGRTTLGDRPISLIDMGDDMAAILEKLGYRQVDVLGYSMGAGVAFRLAVQHPGRRPPAWRWFRRASRRTASILRCCRCRRRWAPAWPR